MAKTSSPMVMRSVYLPEEMDFRLRQVAFFMRKSKADLIRAFVGHGLAALPNLERTPAPEIDRLIYSIFRADSDSSSQEDAAFRADSDKVTAPDDEAEGERIPAQHAAE
jgi:hypothetical protein